MGRRYDEDERPRREWRGMRFLGGVVLGVIVCGGALLALSMNAPNPLHPETEQAAAPAPVPAAQAIRPEAATPPAPGGDSPAPAPAVAAPSRPATQDTPAAVPDGSAGRDSALTGDFDSGDSEVALRTPEAVPAPGLAVDSPENPGLQLEGPALIVNAATFDHDGQRPLMAVILTGAGESTLTQDTLLSLAMPLTIAVAPLDQEDTRLAADARLAGYEVIAELPVRAEADSDALSPSMSDVDIADRVAALLSRTWMSVGAMPRPEPGVSTDERFARAFIAVLERNGFAYVSPPGGDGGAGAIADAFGVPHVGGNVVLEGEVTADEAYAALARAADIAEQTGNAVLRGPATRPMLEGLLRWGLEKGGRSARIAPLSAVVGGPRGARSAGGAN